MHSRNSTDNGNLCDEADTVHELQWKLRWNNSDNTNRHKSIVHGNTILIITCRIRDVCDISGQMPEQHQKAVKGRFG